MIRTAGPACIKPVRPEPDGLDVAGRPPSFRTYLPPPIFTIRFRYHMRGAL